MLSTKTRNWISIGAALCASYVILGAFGAHALKESLSNAELATFHTGLRYLIIHSIGIILVSLITQMTGKNSNAINLLFIAGMLLFSVSLILHATKALLGFDFNFFAMLAPFGGICYIAGWLLFTILLLKK